mmetsp:Transcript_16315/g.41287  ORF Transcript_16315/g.41287 Transcript_16315/m.41287 type:complete len:249 (-) Transcript_16315:1290-2036(-)
MGKVLDSLQHQRHSLPVELVPSWILRHVGGPRAVGWAVALEACNLLVAPEDELLAEALEVALNRVPELHGHRVVDALVEHVRVGLVEDGEEHVEQHKVANDLKCDEEEGPQDAVDLLDGLKVKGAQQRLKEAKDGVEQCLVLGNVGAKRDVEGLRIGEDYNGEDEEEECAVDSGVGDGVCKVGDTLVGVFEKGEGLEPHEDVVEGVPVHHHVVGPTEGLKVKGGALDVEVPRPVDVGEGGEPELDLVD